MSEVTYKQARAWVEANPEEYALFSQFVGAMLCELAANNGKGNRPGWLQMNRREALAEVHWHASKLAVAAKRHDSKPSAASTLEVLELTADVANCAFMAGDVLGALTIPENEPRAASTAGAQTSKE